MKTDFWDNEYFGGPVVYPLKSSISKTYENGTEYVEYHSIINKLSQDLDAEWKSKGAPGSYGYFILRNIESSPETTDDNYATLGRYFVDAYFFARDLDQEIYNFLV